MPGIDLETFLKKFGNVVFVVTITVALVFLGKGMMVLKAKDHAERERKAASICPALLSIGRSSRDTLIVMRAEYLCNDYVLKNFK